jgi:UDP-glucose 4-epimerase
MFDEAIENETHLVTGGLGHIGSYIVEHLAFSRSNSRIVIIDNLYNGKLSNIDIAIKYAANNNVEISIEEKDISDFQQMEKIFQKYKPHFVYHQASMLTLDTKADRMRGIHVNIVGFANIAELCLVHNVRKMVYASSASVFGNPDSIPVDEKHHFNNCKLLYGASKVCNEYLAKSYSDEENLKFVGLRYFNVYGHRQPINNVYTQIVPKWIQAFIEGEPITVYGNGEQTMDLIHGKDVGRLNVIAMEKYLYRKTPMFDGFINIGTGLQTSVMELYEIIKKELSNNGVNVDKSVLIHEDHDPALVKKRQCDNTLMNKCLDKHKISVEQGISITVKEFLRNLEN